MAKRLRDEAEATIDSAAVKVKKAKVKKDRKEKKSKTEDGIQESVSNVIATHTEDAPKQELSKEERKALKRAKKEAAKVADTQESIANGTGEEIQKEEHSKEERQALKKAKKEVEKASTAQQAAESVANGPHDLDAAAKAEKKAYRKAEKAAQKANAVGTLNHDAHGENGAGENIKGAGEAEAAAYYAEKQIAIEDPKKQNTSPVLAFGALPFDEATRNAYFAGFSTPTPIQAAAWPYLFKERDMIGVAETGSGKTYAFGIPCLKRLDKSEERIQVCIVSPTRELAVQIQEQMGKLATPLGLRATCVFGGMSKDDQRKQLKGTHILVATPGRLNDFIGDGTIDLSNVVYLVLDEADRMLDKGFEQDIRKIIGAASASQKRQTVMFTATWPESVRKLASEFLKDPVKITIGDNVSGELRANTRIIQEVEVIEEMEKQNRLFQLLKQYQSGKNRKDRILVFALYKKEATRLEEFIRRRGFPVAGIHGDLSQQKRMESLEAFKKGDVPLLVATDVAARGLDIPAVKVVINVTFPLTVEDYVHRIGRTGRAGQDGRAITLFTQNEKALAGALINVLKKADQPVPEELLRFGTTVKKKGHDAYGAFFKDTTDMKASTKITFD